MRPPDKSVFRHPGQVHALKYALPCGKIGLIVAPSTGGRTPAADAKRRIECKSRFHAGPRLIQTFRAERGQPRDENVRWNSFGLRRDHGATTRPLLRRAQGSLWRS